MSGHAGIFHWGRASDDMPAGSVWCHQCGGWYKTQPVEHNLVQHREDWQGHDGYMHPKTHMGIEDAHALVTLLNQMPSNVGFLLSHVIEQPHSPAMWGGYSAKVILPNGGVGEANHNNPALAFREAWAKAHKDQAEKLTPVCDHEWKEAVHASTGVAWDHQDRFLFCVKCRTSTEKDKVQA